MEKNVVGLPRPCLREELLLPGQVGVRDDGPLGLARGAARVELERGVVVAGLRDDRGDAATGEQPIGGHDPSFGREEGDATRQIRGRDDRAHLRVGAEVRRLRRRVQRREDDDAPACPQDAEHAREKGRARRDEERDALPIEGTPPFEQRRRHAVGRGDGVAPRRLPGRVARDRAGVVGAREPPGQERRGGHARPVLHAAGSHVIRARSRSRSGRRFMRKPTALHGQCGTYASTDSRSMAATIARHPASVSTMKGLLFTLSFISERM